MREYWTGLAQIMDEWLEKGAFYSRAGSYSRSFNAEQAEKEGRFPLSRAAKVVANHAGTSIEATKSFLRSVHDGEWHHVGKFATKVDYHNTAEHLKRNPEELKSEIEQAHAKVAPKQKPQEKIKCWEANYGRQPADWNPTTTTRDGSNLFTREEWAKKLDYHEAKYKAKMVGVTHKGTLKTIQRNLNAIQSHRKLIK